MLISSCLLCDHRFLWLIITFSIFFPHSSTILELSWIPLWCTRWCHRGRFLGERKSVKNISATLTPYLDHDFWPRLSMKTKYIEILEVKLHCSISWDEFTYDLYIEPRSSPSLSPRVSAPRRFPTPNQDQSVSQCCTACAKAGPKHGAPMPRRPNAPAPLYVAPCAYHCWWWIHGKVRVVYWLRNCWVSLNVG